MSKKTLILVVAIVSFVALALVLYGVFTHDEPTFMQICWQDDQAIIDEMDKIDGSCERTEELVWPQGKIPLSVSVEPYAGQLPGFALSQVRDAIELINYQLGYTHLRLLSVEDSGKKSAADIRIVYGTPYEIGDGTTSSDRADGVCKFLRKKRDIVDANSVDDSYLLPHINIRNLGDVQLSYWILIHELGHCALGLAHDDYVSSIMYPKISLNDIAGGRFIRFTDTDRKALRHKYAQ